MERGSKRKWKRLRSRSNERDERGREKKERKHRDVGKGKQEQMMKTRAASKAAVPPPQKVVVEQKDGELFINIDPFLDGSIDDEQLAEAIIAAQGCSSHSLSGQGSRSNRGKNETEESHRRHHRHHHHKKSKKKKSKKDDKKEKKEKRRKSLSSSKSLGKYREEEEDEEVENSGEAEEDEWVEALLFALDKGKTESTKSGSGSKKDEKQQQREDHHRDKEAEKSDDDDILIIDEVLTNREQEHYRQHRISSSAKSRREEDKIPQHYRSHQNRHDLGLGEKPPPGMFPPTAVGFTGQPRFPVGFNVSRWWQQTPRFVMPSGAPIVRVNLAEQVKSQPPKKGPSTTVPPLHKERSREQPAPENEAEGEAGSGGELSPPLNPMMAVDLVNWRPRRVSNSSSVSLSDSSFSFYSDERPSSSSATGPRPWSPADPLVPKIRAMTLGSTEKGADCVEQLLAKKLAEEEAAAQKGRGGLHWRQNRRQKAVASTYSSSAGDANWRAAARPARGHK